jgi:osmoprotectant transport system permease protein
MSAPAQAAVPRDIGLWEWISDPDTWTGPGGILESLQETLSLCAAVIVVAIAIALPLAAWLAHIRKGELGVTWTVTLSRAVPTFAIAGLLVPISLRQGWGFEPFPIFTALLLLALPPIYLNTYTAVKEVNPGAVDAARAMGFNERKVLFNVELALAAALTLTGIRVAAVQVVATEPIRAFLGGDGMGRYVRDGLGQNNDTLLIGGAILIATLAGLTGLAFSLVERIALPKGVRRLKNAGT